MRTRRQAWTHPTLPQMTRMHGLRIGAVLAEVCSQGLEAEVQDCAMQFHGPAPQKLMNAVEPGIIWPRQMRTGHNCSLTDCSYGAKVGYSTQETASPLQCGTKGHAHSGHALGDVMCMLGTARPHLADHAISDGLWGHVGDSAGRGGGNFALKCPSRAPCQSRTPWPRRPWGIVDVVAQQDVACSGHSAVSGGAPQAMTARL